MGDAYTSSGAQHAFLSHGSGPIEDLNDLIPSGSGWTLEQANCVNDNGQIVGLGSIGGHTHAFLLTPTPEPSTLALLGAGAIGLIGYKWRRRRKKCPLAGEIRFLFVVAVVVLTSCLSKPACAQVLYGEGNLGNGYEGLYTINTTNGLMTLVGSDSKGVDTIAFEPATGVLYGEGNLGNGYEGLYTISTTNGLMTLVGSDSKGVGTIAFQPTTEVLYGEGYLGNGYEGLFTISKTTGVMTLVGSDSKGVGTIAFDSTTGVLYGEGYLGNGYEGLYTINTTNGLLTLVGSDAKGVGTIAFEPTTGVLYGEGYLGNGYEGLYTINTTTGIMTLTGSDSKGVGSIAFQPTPTPEPSTLAFLGASAIGFIGYNWRRRKKLARRPSPCSQDETGPAILSFANCSTESKRRTA